MQQACELALANMSKDLQVAAWLGEAWMAQNGLAGARRATVLMRALCKRFWDGLHPLPRDGDYGFRTAPFNWADKYWTQALKWHVVLVRGQGPDARNFTLADWQAALASEAAKAKAKGKPGAGDRERDDQPTIARIRHNVATMPLDALSDALGTLQEWCIEIDALEAELEQRLPHEGPTLHDLKDVLPMIEDMLQTCMEGHPQHAAVPAPAAPAAPEGAPAPPAVGPAALAWQIADREDAYKKLDAIATFLATIEPHNPVPSLIRRALGLGKMPFDELLTELTKNNGELQKFLLSQ